MSFLTFVLVLILIAIAVLLNAFATLVVNIIVMEHTIDTAATRNEKALADYLGMDEEDEDEPPFNLTDIDIPRQR